MAKPTPKVDAIGELSKLYPKATIVGCSTAGEILADDVYDDTVVATCIQFDNTNFKVAKTGISESNQDSFHVGQKLAKQFEQEGLAGIFVLSDGLSVNGSELVKGLQEVLPKEITISGGLAGDGGKFEKTYHRRWYIPTAWLPELRRKHPVEPRNQVVGIILVHQANHSIQGQHTREIDGNPHWNSIKNISAKNSRIFEFFLLFPIVVYRKIIPSKTVRGLGCRSRANTMTFAGDIPEGWCAQLMKQFWQPDRCGRRSGSSHRSPDDSNKLALL